MMIIYTIIYICVLLVRATAAAIGLIFITIPRIILNEIARAMKLGLNLLFYSQRKSSSQRQRP